MNNNDERDYSEEAYNRLILETGDGDNMHAHFDLLTDWPESWQESDALYGETDESYEADCFAESAEEYQRGWFD